MPITKKQGAIFAIYADSPVAKTSRSQALEPSDFTPARASRKSTTTTTTTVPGGTVKKRTLGERKALSALAPAPSSRLLTDEKANDEGKGKGKQAAPSTVTAEGVENAKTTLGLRKLPPRKREVSMATATKTYGSPIKKTRSTPLKLAALATDAPDEIEGSPASRTRSKTKVESIFEGSPMKARTTLTPRGMSKLNHADAILGDGRGALNAKSGRSVAALLKSVHQDEITDENENVGTASCSSSVPGPASKILAGRLSSEIKEVINDLTKGGVISKTKGLRVVELLKGEENAPPTPKGQPTSWRSPVTPKFTHTGSTEAEGLVGTPSKSAGKSTMKSGLRSRAVLADGPLADVSDAYGATGSEPVGFRDISKCKSSTLAASHVSGWG